MATDDKNRGLFLVCDGALCMCDQGASPCALTVTKQQKVKVQNRLVAVSEDNVFQLSTAPFVTCKKNQAQGKPCLYSPSVSKWEKFLYEGEKKSIVTEKSEMKCPFLGGKITVLYHGQKVTVCDTDFADFSIDSVYLYNNLLSAEFLNEQLKTKEKSSPQSDISFPVFSIKSNGTSNGVSVRPDAPLVLTAYGKQDVELKEKPVSWVVFQLDRKEVPLKGKKEKKTKIVQSIKNLHIYTKVGTPFTLQLHDIGEYYVEGMGTESMLKKYMAIHKGEASPIFVEDKKNKCISRIGVEKNRITKAEILGCDAFCDGIYYRKNSYDFVVLSIKTLYEISDEEFLSVNVRQGFNVICSFTSENNKSKDYSFSYDLLSKCYCFTYKKHMNERAYYEFEIFLNRNVQTYSFLNLPIKLNNWRLNLSVINDFISICAKIGNRSQPSMLRPHDCMDFSVTLGDGKVDLRDEIDFLKISWQKCRGNKVLLSSVGSRFMDNNPQTLQDGEYEAEVMVYANLNNCGLKMKGTDVNQYVYSYLVALNRVVDLSIQTKSGIVYKGVRYKLNVECLYQERSMDDAPLSVFDEQNEVVFNTIGGLEKTVTFSEANKHTLVAKMGDKTPQQTLEINVVEPKVETWEFCDEEERKIEKVSFSCGFRIHICVPAWGESIEKCNTYVHLWNDKQKKFICLEELKNPVSFDNSGCVFIDIQPQNPDFWKQQSVDIDGICTDELSVSFFLSNPPCMLQDLNFMECNGMSYYRARNSLVITNKLCLFGYFSGFYGNKQKSTMIYDEDFKITLYLLNITDLYREKLRLCLYENNKENDADDMIWQTDIPAPIKEDGRVDLALNCIKEKDHVGVSWQPRLFYFKVFSEGVLKYAYPSSQEDVYNMNITNDMDVEHDIRVVDKLRSYLWQLKVAKETSKNQCAALTHFAPVVIGEELTKGEKMKENTKCFCCRDFTVDEVKSMIKYLKGKEEIWEQKGCDVDDESWESFTRELNLAFRKYGISKCVQKIVFLAICAVETKLYSSSFEIPCGTKSSKSLFRGRGLIHLTYESGYEKYSERLPGVDLTDTAHNQQYLLETNLHYVVDSGCVFFTNTQFKSDIKWNKDSIDENIKQRVKKFIASVSIKYHLSLNELALLMEGDDSGDEETYYFLINKLINGYGPKEKVDTPPNGWDTRKTYFNKLKEWFNYDKKVCKSIEKQFPTINKDWHDPIDNPCITVISQNGNDTPSNAAFGCRTESGRFHQGVDLYALEGTPVYSCLDGRVVSAAMSKSGSGRSVVIEVHEERQLQIFRNRRRKYVPYYPLSYTVDEKTGIKKVNYPYETDDGPDFNANSDVIYFVYYHLSEFYVKSGDPVKAGQEIGKSGISGVSEGTKGPHLHFEIKSKNTYLDGLKDRCNPAFYVYYKEYDGKYKKKDGSDATRDYMSYLTKEEFEIQKRRKEKGKLKE